MCPGHFGGHPFLEVLGHGELHQGVHHRGAFGVLDEGIEVLADLLQVGVHNVEVGGHADEPGLHVLDLVLDVADLVLDHAGALQVDVLDLLQDGLEGVGQADRELVDALQNGRVRRVDDLSVDRRSGRCEPLGAGLLRLRRRGLFVSLLGLLGSLLFGAHLVVVPAAQAAGLQLVVAAIKAADLLGLLPGGFRGRSGSLRLPRRGGGALPEQGLAGDVVAVVSEGGPVDLVGLAIRGLVDRSQDRLGVAGPLDAGIGVDDELPVVEHTLALGLDDGGQVGQAPEL